LTEKGLIRVGKPLGAKRMSFFSSCQDLALSRRSASVGAA
jgi:hypothetical protein